MAKAIFNVLFNVLIGLANLILFPLNSLINSLVPNLSTAITNLTSAINLFLTNGLSWGFSLLPPITKYFVTFYLGFLVVYYTISYSVHGIIWVIKIIKKLPFA